MGSIRLDRYLADVHVGSRKQIREYIRDGRVRVNGEVIAKTEHHVDTRSDTVSFDGKDLVYFKHRYILLNKPAGVVSATKDGLSRTVIDLLSGVPVRRLSPIGRLDKDTEGLLLITDDGEFAHNILSPRHHVDKTYIAKLDKPFSDEVKADFESGMNLGEEKLLPAELKAICNDNTKAEIILREGIYHQIKRMFKKHGITVLELKRIALGELHLDKNLKDGECRYLTNEDLTKITKTK